MSNDKLEKDLDNTISDTFLDDLLAILDKNNSTYQAKTNKVNAEAKTLLEETNAYKATNADKAIPIELVERYKEIRRKSYCIYESINKYVDSMEAVLEEDIEEDATTLTLFKIEALGKKFEDCEKTYARLQVELKEIVDEILDKLSGLRMVNHALKIEL